MNTTTKSSTNPPVDSGRILDYILQRLVVLTPEQRYKIFDAIMRMDKLGDEEYQSSHSDDDYEDRPRVSS